MYYSYVTERCIKKAIVGKRKDHNYILIFCLNLFLVSVHTQFKSKIHFMQSTGLISRHLNLINYDRMMSFLNPSHYAKKYKSLPAISNLRIIIYKIA
jgi:hypothetical protein